MFVFGVVIVLVFYLSVLGERCQVVGEIEDPPAEIVAQCAIAFAFALPIGVGIALLLGRQLTHRTTERLDEVIASAARMTGERLDERLPVGDAGDPLDRLGGALNGVLERIESGVAAQTQFAADASHELRTPLTVISTNLEVARRKVREPGHWEQVADSTLAEVQRMTVLVEKLLLLSRAGAAGLHHARADLRALAGAAVERSSLVAAERGIKVELTSGSGVVVDVDADAIAIVLDNLLRNALDHSPRDQIVSVTVGPGARVCVEDRGPGVPADQRARIFEPFARGIHRDTDRAGDRPRGVGLGLAISKRIVGGHGGTLVVADRPGGGASFIVELAAVTPASRSG